MTAAEEALREKVAGILKVPAFSRLESEERDINEYRRLLHSRMRGIVDNAEHWDRDLTEDEEAEHAQLKAEFDALN